MCFYKVEEIIYNDRRIRIVCHDENGPCPLIAIANYIILHRGLNVMPNSNGYVSQKYLFTLVSIHLNSELAELLKEGKVKTDQVKELLAPLPNFAKGFFINPHVNSISGFDKTPELTLIEYLGIPLIHGWVVDEKVWSLNIVNISATPQLGINIVPSALGGSSYNDLTLVDVLHKSMEMFQEENSAGCASTVSLTSKDDAMQNTKDEDDQKLKHDITQQQDEKTTRKLIKDLSQLTSHGFSCLRDYMLKEGNELAVLYWDEHFHLMHMHDETLYTLQADLSTRTIHPNAVWQTLDPVYGDIFVTEKFFMPINDEDTDSEENLLYLQHLFEFANRRMEKVVTSDKLIKEEIGALEAELKEVQKQKHEKSVENFAIKVAEAKEHENELLETIEKEKLKQEKKAKKKEKHKKPLQIQQSIEVDVAPGMTPFQQEQSIEVIPDGAPRTTPLQQQQSIEVIPDGAPPGTTPPQQEQNIEVTLHDTPGVTPLQKEQDTEVIQDNIAAAKTHQHEESNVTLPYDANWVAGRFMKFLTNFNYYGKSKTPYFEGEIEAMKYRNLFELSIQYSDICHDCEELSIIIRDHYDSVLEVLRGSVKKYLVKHGVEVNKAEEAVLKIHGRPTSYRSFADFAEENQNALIEFVEIYMKTFATSTTELGRRMSRGYLRYIINMHRKGYCWKGDWKASDMKVRSNGSDFIITKVPDYNISKEGMTADFEKFSEIVFPFYEHEAEEVNRSGEMEKKQVLPSYFLQFKENCKEVPDPNTEPVELENFQKFLGSHPAFMSPMTMTTFIGNLFICCDNLRGVHDVFKPLHTPILGYDWRTDVKDLCKSFTDIYCHLTTQVYDLSYWSFLKFLRNFIQHMRTHEQDHDIAMSGVMIGHGLAEYVPALILYSLNNCNMNSLFFSTTWNRFEESD